MDSFLNKTRITADKLFSDTVDFLVTKFKQSTRIFTYASSAGQIILTLHNISQLIFYYIQDSISQLNFKTSNRLHVVQGMSTLQGHNPSRGRSAIGDITLRLKPTANISEIAGKILHIPNYSRIKCLSNSNSNGLFYMLNLGQNDVIYDLTNPINLNLKVIQGILDFQIFTGTGGDYQTYEINILPNVWIDDSTVEVRVNGELYEQVDSLLDISYKQKACIVRTGITSGIDIIFGNELNASVPELGSQIRIDYIKTDGASGNIIGKDSAVLEFEDYGFDILGKDIELKDLFFIVINNNPDLGSDPEPIELTKILAPNISRNFIIHDDRSIMYFLRKMNYFNIIKILKSSTNNINEYKVIVIPKITDRMNAGEDYFSVSTNNFLLTDIEKTRLLNSIIEGGRKSANITISFIDPQIKRYIIMLYVECFKQINGIPADKNTIRLNIRSVLSNYALTNTRISKIPHSDIVKAVDNVPYVDTVKAVFVSEDGTGFDAFGNISLANEDGLALIRGGWSDANGVNYEDEFDPENEKLGSVNIQIAFVD